jgi:hypothetical protein
MVYQTDKLNRLENACVMLGSCLDSVTDQRAIARNANSFAHKTRILQLQRVKRVLCANGIVVTRE